MAGNAIYEQARALSTMPAGQVSNDFAESIVIAPYPTILAEASLPDSGIKFTGFILLCSAALSLWRWRVVLRIAQGLLKICLPFFKALHLYPDLLRRLTHASARFCCPDSQRPRILYFVLHAPKIARRWQSSLLCSVDLSFRRERSRTRRD